MSVSSLVLSLLVIVAAVGLVVLGWIAITNELSKLRARTRDLELGFEAERTRVQALLEDIGPSVSREVFERSSRSQNLMSIPSGLDRRVQRLEQLLDRCDRLGGRTPVKSSASTMQTTPMLSVPREEAGLLSIANQLWRSDKPNRTEMARMAERLHLQVSWYAIKDIESNLTNVNWAGP